MHLKNVFLIRIKKRALNRIKKINGINEKTVGEITQEFREIERFSRLTGEIVFICILITFICLFDFQLFVIILVGTFIYWQAYLYFYKKQLSDNVAIVASQIAKEKKIRKLVYSFQKKCAYSPPKKYNGSCLDGRDICSVIIPDADIKLFITANTKTRALRRFKELKTLNKKVTYEEVLKSIKNRDKSDYNRKISPLKKTKDSVLINTTNLSKRACFLKIKKIIERKINY